VKPWVSYSLIRLGLFAVALTALLLLGVPEWLAAIAAALIGLSVAYIFFRPQRDELIASVRRVPTTDEEAEDALEGDRER
jgi:hypothetical protein